MMISTRARDSQGSSSYVINMMISNGNVEIVALTQVSLCANDRGHQVAGIAARCSRASNSTAALLLLYFKLQRFSCRALWLTYVVSATHFVRV
jgi:hypothetical protein